MTRSCRALVITLLSLLLVGMQSEGLRHAVAHRAAALLSPQEQSLQLPNDAPCIECRLLAGGSNVLAASLQAVAVVSFVPVLVLALPRSIPQSAPSYYQSRAPPALL